MSDLIRRESAIEATRNAPFSFTIKSDIDFANYRKEIQEIFNNVLDAQEKALNELPSAERKGKWINEPYEKGLYVHRCSNCLKASGIGGGDLWFNFCPNCGAYMRGEEDE